jgi:protein-S-isoprenylcysteine O-methyltransferase Ste14
MVNSADVIRRWLVAIFLLIAVVMVICGQTVLKSRLRQEAFLYYWAVCILFTGLTFIAALVDLWIIRRRARRERRDLLNKTFAGLDLDMEIPEEKDRARRNRFKP